MLPLGKNIMMKKQDSAMKKLREALELEGRGTQGATCYPDSVDLQFQYPSLPCLNKFTINDVNAKRVPEETMLLAIPKSIHLIWLGGSIPQEYLENIFKLAPYAKKNGFKVNLWVDNDFNFHGAVNRFHNTNRNVEISNTLKSAITLKNIMELKTDPQTVNDKILWKIIHSETTGLFCNYAAASDILRLMILKKEGGYYFDTDLKMLTGKNLTEEDPKLFIPNAKYSFLCRFCGIVPINDAIAAMVGHEILQTALDDIVINYNERIIDPLIDVCGTDLAIPIINKRQYTPTFSFEHIGVIDARRQYTMELTGPSVLRYAINKYLKKYPGIFSQELYFNKIDLTGNDFGNDFIKMFYIKCCNDNTWLRPLKWVQLHNGRECLIDFKIC